MWRIAVTAVAIAGFAGAGRFAGATGVTAASDPAEAIVYAGWAGGCEPGKLGGLVCIMSREARSAAGRRLGVLGYGEADTARFLFVEADLIGSPVEPALVARLDGKVVSNGRLTCRDGNAVCFTTIVVDNGLLERLAHAAALVVEERTGRRAVLQFPLAGFAQARMKLL